MANQCEQLARLLRDDGFDVAVVRTNAPYRPAWVGRLPVLRAGFRLFPYVVALLRACGPRRVVHVFANSGWAWYLFATPAIWIAKLRGARVIVNYRGGNAARFFAVTTPLALRTLKAADALVTPSGFLARVFKALDVEAEVVPNIVDLTRFRSEVLRPGGDAPHLIVTRNLEPIYDIPCAIRAFGKICERFPRARLSVAGTGPEREPLLRLSEELGLASRIRFTGRIPNGEIPALYASADCMLNPSRVDNMPISILEALASGVPVVSTDAGGIPDMVENGVSAILVPVGDAEAMAVKAIAVLEDAATAGALRDEGLRRAKEFDWSIIRDRWLEIYRRVGLCSEGTAEDA
ncbi:MAG: glycosyltransferase [Rhodocyclaceae bacterium]|nr:glycosyltransferase [Rhodocyclaceae bacterium]